jgi:hypothetical protein
VNGRVAIEVLDKRYFEVCHISAFFFSNLPPFNILLLNDLIQPLNNVQVLMRIVQYRVAVGEDIQGERLQVYGLVLVDVELHAVLDYLC